MSERTIDTLVPIIDLAPFTTGDEASRQSVAAAVDAACRDVGFFTVVGHGIPTATLDATWAAALAFFELPIEQRMTVAMPYPGYPYGYNAFNVEALNRSIGGDAPPDLKETFNVGPIDPPPRPIDEMDDDDERAVYAPNRLARRGVPCAAAGARGALPVDGGPRRAPDGGLRGRARPARPGGSPRTSIVTRRRCGSPTTRRSIAHRSRVSYEPAPTPTTAR